MERLFEFLLFNPRISFEGHSHTLVKLVPKPLSAEYVTREQTALYEATKRVGLVVYTRRTVQCVVWPERPRTEEEELRERLVDASREAGLCYNWKAMGEIEMQEEGVSSRRG